MTEIMWDRAKLSRLKAAVKIATVKGDDSFVFDGNEFVVGYAKYLIEYLDLRLPQS